MLEVGIFDFGDGVRLTPSTSEVEFEGLSPSIERGPFHADYHWYSVKRGTWNGRQINLSVCFHDGQLERLHFAKDHGAEDPWKDWTEEGVRADKLEHDLWLAELTGTSPPYAYDWGEVKSLTDWKGGFSAIFVAFSSR